MYPIPTFFKLPFPMKGQEQHKTEGRVLDATTTSTSSNHNNRGVFCQLAPCLAQFTVEEDRQHIAQTLREVAQFKASELQKAGDHHGQQLLQVGRVPSVLVGTG